MTWQMRWTAGAVVPAPGDLARAMGLPDGRPFSPRTSGLVDEARGVFLRLAAPCAVAAEVTPDAFARVYAGDGRNDATTPLEGIHPRAEALALFVATLGAPVSDAIGDLFARDQAALAYVLDTLASEAADTLAMRVSREVEERARRRGSASSRARALPYSPGYCGWHISGQAALFSALGPGPAVGVTLGDSFLMQPLKTVSGVVVVGGPDVHAIDTDHDCCVTCQTRQCQDRLAALVRE
jgi:hypothetical protein